MQHQQQISAVSLESMGDTATSAVNTSHVDTLALFNADSFSNYQHLTAAQWAADFDGSLQDMTTFWETVGLDIDMDIATMPCINPVAAAHQSLMSQSESAEFEPTASLEQLATPQSMPSVGGNVEIRDQLDIPDIIAGDG